MGLGSAAWHTAIADCVAVKWNGGSGAMILEYVEEAADCTHRRSRWRWSFDENR